MSSVKEIIDLMDSPTEKDKELIQKAYDFAFKAHEGQLRKSGEPYFVHVYETAKILTEFKMCVSTIIAGFLHDSIEDGVATEECIKKEFGDEILFLVNGVTKLGKVKYRGAERHVESLRKFIVASAQDIRVLIIKLADRLHNMRTIKFVRPDKQKRISLETLEIYAPLAYRLSIRKLSRELEDLSFENAFPEKYNEVVKLKKNIKSEMIPRLEKFIKSVKKVLAEEGMVNIHTDYRKKGIYSLFKKLETHENDIDKIYDILAIRICVENIADCYKVLGIIHGTWRPLPGRIKDYIAFPKPNGYKSIHTTVFTGDGSIIEIQIRTFEMHQESEYGIASHLSYKNNNKNTEETNWFKQFFPKIINFSIAIKNKSDKMPKWIQELADSQNSIETKSEKDGFINDLKADFFNQRIFVFTPKGEVVDLPDGSFILDFAYAIHSDVGNHTNSAKTNGKLVSLDSKLKNGDIVEIFTNKSNNPNERWQNIVKTNMAKRHIANYLERTRRR